MAAPKAATFRRIDSIAQLACTRQVASCLDREVDRRLGLRLAAASAVHAWGRALCATSHAGWSSRR
eukprot:1959246-Pleurochrysis_carterae.AAC.2